MTKSSPPPVIEKVQVSEATFYKNQLGEIYSVYPPQTFLTFDYWIYMVPQYRPENVLMLGYAGGTVAGLIRLIWGDVPITAVDIEPCDNRYGVNFIQADAKEFVKNCPAYDVVLIDLFDNNTGQNCPFVTDPDFLANLTKIGNYLIVNSLGLDMSAFRHLKQVGINKPSGSKVLIYYYQTKDNLPKLHPSQ